MRTGSRLVKHWGFLRKKARFLAPHIKKYLPWILLAFVLGFYGMLQAKTFTPAYMEEDPDGYLWLAKRIARGQSLTVEPPDLFRYHSHIWVENDRGHVIPKFAPGYPLLLAAGYRLFGDEGMFVVSPAMGFLTLLATFLLIREWTDGFVALLVTVSLAANRMFLYYTGYLLTHATNVCFVTWGMYFLWKWLRKPGPVWATCAGLCLGYAATVRHTSALVVLSGIPAVAAVILRGRRQENIPWKGIVALILAGIIFPLLLLAYNNSVYGGMFTTGYQMSGEQFAFSLGYLKDNLPVLVGGLASEMLPFLFPLGLAGIVLLGHWHERLMRLLWFCPLLVAYSAYYWSTDSQAYFRFMIVTMPLLAGAGYMLIDRAWPLKWFSNHDDSIPPAKRWGPTAAMVTLCGALLITAHDHVGKAYEGRLYGHNSRNFARAVRGLAALVESDAVVFTRHPFSNYAGTRESWTLYDLNAFQRKYGRRKFSQRKGRERWPHKQPRRHPERTARFRKFYDETSQGELTRLKQEIINTAARKGKQVVFFVRKGRKSWERETLPQGCKLQLICETQISWEHWRRRPRDEEWHLYELECQD
ncbi:MAG: ArnT family glycosyltransferase [Candidatus Brocadiia bacterium]